MRFKMRYSEIRVHHKIDCIKIKQFTKFEVMLLDCFYAEGFQKLEKLETVWIRGTPFQNKRHLYGIWATFDRSQPGYYAMKHNQT